jgi:hypothetical protein
VSALSGLLILAGLVAAALAWWPWSLLVLAGGAALWRLGRPQDRG